MELGRGCPAQAPADGCLPARLERNPGLLPPAWTGGLWGQHHDLEMLVRGSAQGYVTKGLGKARSDGAGGSEDRPS